MCYINIILVWCALDINITLESETYYISITQEPLTMLYRLIYWAYYKYFTFGVCYSLQHVAYLWFFKLVSRMNCCILLSVDKGFCRNVRLCVRESFLRLSGFLVIFYSHTLLLFFFNITLKCWRCYMHITLLCWTWHINITIVCSTCYINITLI